MNSLRTSARLRYTLRTLLIVIAAVSVAFAWCANRQHPAALHVAARSGDSAQVRQLLDSGFPVNLPSSSEWDGFGSKESPLHVAVRYAQLDVAKLLIERNADVNAGDRYYETPLFVAFDRRLTALLLNHGANVNVRSDLQYGPLHRLARYSRDPRAVELLLQHGAEIDAKTNVGTTPLHEAMISAVPEVVEVLLSYGADPNARTHSGLTPLHWAVMPSFDVAAKDPKPALRLLVQYSGDVNVTDNDGVTPLGFATVINDHALITVLKELGARDRSSEQK